MSVRRLGRLVVIVVLGGTAAACSDPEIDRMKTIKSEICACKSSACADEALKHVADHDVPSNRHTQELARAMLDCIAKLHDEDRPSTDPDKGEPTATGPAGAGPTDPEQP